MQLEQQVKDAAARLAAEEARLRALDEELHNVHEQRRAWEQQWQQWLQNDGVLQRGHFYNLRNLSLAAWEVDVTERREPVVAARASAREDLDRIRSRFRPAYLRLHALDALFRADELRERAMHAEMRQDETLDEVTSHEWVVQHPCNR
jgi:hypothetical protein